MGHRHAYRVSRDTSDVTQTNHTTRFWIRLTGSRAGQYDLALESDLQCGGSKLDGASSVAQLTNGEQGMVGNVGKDVTKSRFYWEVGYIQFGDMCGVHDAAVGVANSNWISCDSLVDDRVG